MKNLLKAATVLLFGLFFTACKKDYTCTCVVNREKYLYDYNGRLKSEAEKACSQQNAEAKKADPKGICSLSKN